jgi:hypothetical protein
MNIGYFFIGAIGGYWWLFYLWLLVDIISVAIGGYSMLYYNY